MNESEPDTSSPHETESGGLIQLSLAEARVLGCLLEKEATTPDNYPLTLNALHSACNQSSNRDPVLDLGTDEVEDAMQGLRYRHLGILVHQAGARVAKNKHTLEQVFPSLTEGEQALLCVLLLRGQQTVGELRQRTERLHRFADIASTEATLRRLCEYEPDPLVRHVPAGGGRRTATYMHLFCGENEPATPVSKPSPLPSGSPGPESGEGGAPLGWRDSMEQQIEDLRSEVGTLRAEIDHLRSELGA